MISRGRAGQLKKWRSLRYEYGRHLYSACRSGISLLQTFVTRGWLWLDSGQGTFLLIPRCLPQCCFIDSSSRVIKVKSAYPRSRFPGPYRPPHLRNFPCGWPGIKKRGALFCNGTKMKRLICLKGTPWEKEHIAIGAKTYIHGFILRNSSHVILPLSSCVQISSSSNRPALRTYIPSWE